MQLVPRIPFSYFARTGAAVIATAGPHALLGFAAYRVTVAAGLALWPIDRAGPGAAG